MGAILRQPALQHQADKLRGPQAAHARTEEELARRCFPFPDGSFDFLGVVVPANAGTQCR
jgi:hypothetical protein